MGYKGWGSSPVSRWLAGEDFSKVTPNRVKLRRNVVTFRADRLGRHIKSVGLASLSKSRAPLRSRSCKAKK